jgi:hypothetical protein
MNVNSFRELTLAMTDTYPQQGRRDSNSQPPVLETGALPIELHPYDAQTAWTDGP